jgi:hypothetical protein
MKNYLRIASAVGFLAAISYPATAAEVNVSIYQSATKLQGLREAYEQNTAASPEQVVQVLGQGAPELVEGQTLQLTPKLMTNPSAPVDLTGYEGVDWDSKTPWLISVSNSGLVTAARAADYVDTGSGIGTTGKGIVTLTYRAPNGDVGYNEVQINVLPGAAANARSKNVEP